MIISSVTLVILICVTLGISSYRSIYRGMVNMGVEEQMREMADTVNEKKEKSRTAEKISTLTNNIINITEQTSSAAAASEIQKVSKNYKDDVGDMN